MTRLGIRSQSPENASGLFCVFYYESISEVFGCDVRRHLRKNMWRREPEMKWTCNNCNILTNTACLKGRCVFGIAYKNFVHQNKIQVDKLLFLDLHTWRPNLNQDCSSSLQGFCFLFVCLIKFCPSDIFNQLAFCYRNQWKKMQKVRNFRFENLKLRWNHFLRSW